VDYHKISEEVLPPKEKSLGLNTAERTIIVGASGMMGRALMAAARAASKEVIGTYNSNKRQGLIRYDMREARLGDIIAGIGPQDTVYLLSAYTNVAWVYANQQQARELNLHATKRLIDEIADAGARIIFMSSVEVFDGQQGNYNEHSLPNPLTSYGRMKFEIEQYLSKKKCQSCTVRIGWSVGWDIESPCVVKFTYKTLMAPGAKMAHDNIFSIIDVKDTCEGLLRLSQAPEVGICHLASVPPIVRTELASMVMKFSKYKNLMSYETVPFSEIPYSQKRSRDTHLDNSLAMSLGMKFRPPEDIVREKVELLDRYEGEGLISRSH
jgi:dTDP-4-dehydrorhamnose reductase